VLNLYRIKIQNGSKQYKLKRLFHR